VCVLSKWSLKWSWFRHLVYPLKYSEQLMEPAPKKVIRKHRALPHVEAAWSDFPTYYHAATKMISSAQHKLEEFQQRLCEELRLYNRGCVSPSYSQLQCRVGVVELHLHGWEVNQVSSPVPLQTGYMSSMTRPPHVGAYALTRSEEASLQSMLDGLLNLCCGGQSVSLLCGHSVCACKSSLQCEKCLAPTVAPKANLTFNCSLCLELRQTTASSLLGCGHRYCLDCLRRYLVSKIEGNAGGVNELKCPENCKEELSESLLRQVLDTSQHNRLEQLRLPQVIEDSVLASCLKAGCSNKAYIHRGRSRFDCSACNTTHCLKCHSLVESGTAHQCNRREESKQLKGIEHLDLKTCPRCEEGLQKESGCNFVRCPSAICRGETYFCWLCKEVLNTENHYAHFKKGPYAGECMNSAKLAAKTGPRPSDNKPPSPVEPVNSSCSCTSKKITLSCNHKLCATCLQLRILTNHAKGQQEIKCFNCPRKLNKKQIYKAFGGERNYREKLLEHQGKEVWRS
jgi:hypothetical protein